MAIDSADKRKAAMNIGSFGSVLPAASGSIGQWDRYILLCLYYEEVVREELNLNSYITTSKSLNSYITTSKSLDSYITTSKSLDSYIKD